MLSLSKSTARQPRKWTTAEDQKLREEVEAQKNEGEVKDWCRVAAKLPGRTNKDCRKRWLNSVAGGLKKGQWAKNEDILLQRGVQQFGQRWTLVADVVGSRSADQCAKRWQQSLDPELDRSEWRESEDQILIEAVQRLGRHWKDIQRHHFPGRSKNCIKNRYTVIVRRYQNSGISLPEGAVTPESNTPSNRLSTYSAPDDDSLSYTSSIYDEMLTTQTQVSTPESNQSWSIEEEPFSWSSQDFSTITSSAGATEFPKYPQHPSPNVSASSQWTWAAPSMEQPPAMGLEPTNAYGSNFASQPPSPYGSYGALQGILPVGPTSTPPATSAHRTSFIARAPTSSPQPPSASYQDPEAMSRFMRYGMQNDPPYRY